MPMGAGHRGSVFGARGVGKLSSVKTGGIAALQNRLQHVWLLLPTSNTPPRLKGVPTKSRKSQFTVTPPIAH